MTDDSREARFSGLYASTFDALLGFALRRVSRPEDAADVVAETFLTAWRRFDDIPPGDEARLWLYGVARRTLANQRRSAERRLALTDRIGSRLRRELAAAVPDPADGVTEQVVVREALARLADRDREVLELTAWEGLTGPEIAQVLGVSEVAVRARLSRARKRYRAAAGHSPPDDGHVPLDRLTTTHGPKEHR